MQDQDTDPKQIELLEEILKVLKKNSDPQKHFWFTFRFVEGIFYGLGATLGLAIIIGVVGFVVKEFGGVPVVGHWLIMFGRSLHQ